MEDLRSEHEARDLIEARIKDGNLRHRYLSVLAEAIREANRLDPAQWVVTTEGKIPRLVVGHYYTYTGDDLDQGVWIALDSVGYRRLLAKGAPQAFYGAWKPDKANQYPSYQDRFQNPISVNGYYDLAVDNTESWHLAEGLSFQFLSKATDPELGRPMTSISRGAHSPGVLAYVRSALGIDLPEPRP